MTAVARSVPLRCETFNLTARHIKVYQMIYKFEELEPQLAEGVFIAPNATIIGNVIAEAEVSVWFGAVIRGDDGLITIGERSNIQENCVVHVNEQFDTLIGRDVTLGHGVIVEGCEIGDGCLIGMGAIVLSGAKVGKGCVVAAGAVVREGEIVPDGSLVAGVPAKVVRQLSDEVVGQLPLIAEHYTHQRTRYMRGLQPLG